MDKIKGKVEIEVSTVGRHTVVRVGGKLKGHPGVQVHYTYVLPAVKITDLRKTKK